MPPSRSLRLFVAVYPPPEVAAALVAALGRVGGLPAHRRVPAAQVHLTLQFIGDTPADHVDDVVETVTRAARGLGDFELTPQRLITLPPRGTARLVAAETDSPPGLLELHRRLVTRLARAPRGRPGDRFRPHLTLCRFATPSRVTALDAPLAGLGFPVDHVALMRSALLPQGARHDRVAAITLSR